MLNGIFLGILTAVSIIMTFLKWPPWLKRLVVRHELIADVIAGLSVWAILGMISKTLTAVIGAVIGEIILGLVLHWYVEKENANKVLSKTRR